MIGSVASGLVTAPAERAAVRPVGVAGRVAALDGLRGLMTLFVLFSHYVVEVPHGIGIFSVGWVAVIVFFVLSGYLVGWLIIEKQESGNFLFVFYLRRMCRTFPTYFLSTALLLAVSAWLGDRSWTHGPPPLPAWSYFVFAQNVFITLRESVGLHWLSPTWTLALEEQFYVLAPLLFLGVPRRLWVPVLSLLCAAGLGLRAYGVLSGTLSFAPLVLMPASMDVLCAGLLLAVLVKRGAIDWARWSRPLRIAPIVVMFGVALVQRLDGGVVGHEEHRWPARRIDHRGPVHPDAGRGCTRSPAVRGTNAALLRPDLLQPLPVASRGAGPDAWRDPRCRARFRDACASDRHPRGRRRDGCPQLVHDPDPGGADHGLGARHSLALGGSYADVGP